MQTNNQEYRNINAIEVNDVEIDPGALWILKNNMLVLVDLDQYIETIFESNLFQPVQ